MNIFFFFGWEKGKEDEHIILATVFAIALACHFLLSMYVVEIKQFFRLLWPEGKKIKQFLFLFLNFMCLINQEQTKWGINRGHLWCTSG